MERIGAESTMLYRIMQVIVYVDSQDILDGLMAVTANRNCLSEDMARQAKELKVQQAIMFPLVDCVRKRMEAPMDYTWGEAP
jgi:hypothetical protein